MPYTDADPNQDLPEPSVQRHDFGLLRVNARLRASTNGGEAHREKTACFTLQKRFGGRLLIQKDASADEQTPCLLLPLCTQNDRRECDWSHQSPRALAH
jgi:hypothetical protein